MKHPGGSGGFVLEINGRPRPATYFSEFVLLKVQLFDKLSSLEPMGPVTKNAVNFNTLTWLVWVQDLVKRLDEFILMYNAQSDSSNPKSGE